MVTLGFDDPLFAQFAFYSVLLILKTLALALLIIRIRIKRKVCFILIDDITNKYFIYMLVFKAFLRDIFSIPIIIQTCISIAGVYFSRGLFTTNCWETSS